MGAQFEGGALLLALSLTACGPAPLTSATYRVMDNTQPAVAVACDAERAAVVHPEGFRIVQRSEDGVTTESEVTGPEFANAGGQGSTRLVGDRLVVAFGEKLQIYDLSALPEVVMGTVPAHARSSFELDGHTLYAGDTMSGVIVYDIADVTAPHRTDSTSVPGDPAFMRVHNGVLYALDDRLISVVALPLDDLHNTSPSTVDTGAVYSGPPDTRDHFTPFLIVGDYLYLNFVRYGILQEPATPVAIDISNPASLVVTQAHLEAPADSVAILPMGSDGAGGIIGTTRGWQLSDVKARGNEPSIVGALDITLPATPTQRTGWPQFDFDGLAGLYPNYGASELCYAGDTLLASTGGMLVVSRRR